MYLKTYLWLALVLLIAVGMGCSSADNTNSTGTGSGGDSSLYGTWNLVSSSGGVFPTRISFSSNGTGSYIYSGGNATNFNWTQSGSQVTLTTANSSTATINNLTFPVGNTFTLNSLGGSGNYTRA
jgi:hypothetical protein